MGEIFSESAEREFLSSKDYLIDRLLAKISGHRGEPTSMFTSFGGMFIHYSEPHVWVGVMKNLKNKTRAVLIRGREYLILRLVNRKAL